MLDYREYVCRLYNLKQISVFVWSGILHLFAVVCRIAVSVIVLCMYMLYFNNQTEDHTSNVVVLNLTVSHSNSDESK